MRKYCFLIISPLIVQSYIVIDYRFDAFIPREQCLAQSSSKRVRPLDVLMRNGGTESGVKVLSSIGLDHVSRANPGIEDANRRIPRMRMGVSVGIVTGHGELKLLANAAAAGREVKETAIRNEGQVYVSPTNSTGSTGGNGRCNIGAAHSMDQEAL
jgi:hypothetical protein